MAICGIEIGIEILTEWTRDRIEIGSIQKFELIEDRDRMALGSGSTGGLLHTRAYQNYSIRIRATRALM